MVEQRVIGAKIGARPAASSPEVDRKPDAAPAGEAPPKRRRKGLVIVIVVGLVVAAAAAAWLLLGKGGDGTAEPTPTPTPVAGEVLDVDAVSVNLAAGHYLRLGIALQLSADVKEKPDTAKTLDLAIALYSGRSVDEVSAAASRDQLKAQLLAELQQAYGPGVMDVYLTDYVTQ